MTQFPQNSHFAQVQEATKRVQEEVLQNVYDRESDWHSRPKSFPRMDVQARIRNWAADLSFALNDMTEISSERTAATAFTEGVQRIDEIIREMDSYGTRET